MLKKKAFVIKGKLWDSRICQNKYNQSGKYFADNYYSNVIEYTNKNLTLPKMKTLKKGRYIVYLNLEWCPF